MVKKNVYVYKESSVDSGGSDWGAQNFDRSSTYLKPLEKPWFQF